MSNIVRKIVILGGGTAGWITAGILASRFSSRIANNELNITVCESPNIPIIGVGEGTWPTMPSTLKSIGISETEFIKECEASFKQGSKFVGWDNDRGEGYYHHPFENLNHAAEGYFANYWNKNIQNVSFAKTFSKQEAVSEQGLAPKCITDAEYQSSVNYGYHLNASLFSNFLQRHCTSKLGVKHVLAEMTKVNRDETGGIHSLSLDNHDNIEADLFVDCTGFKSLLLGSALGVKFNSVDDTLFADTALATQVQYSSPNAAIASYTKSTAQEAGWIWDIGLPTRRGVGHVFSSKYTTIEKAKEDLILYVKSTGGDTNNLKFKEIHFKAGHREKLWYKNCVAVGLSAGFLEPLEASALVLVELSANLIADQLPCTKNVMEISAQRFNNKLLYHWGRAIDFLKLHYVLSQRTSPFWIANKNKDSIPIRLQELLLLWESKVPTGFDFEPTGELFQAASYQFVLYGSNFKTNTLFSIEKNIDDYVTKQIEIIKKEEARLIAKLPTNRDLLNKIYKYGLSSI